MATNKKQTPLAIILEQKGWKQSVFREKIKEKTGKEFSKAAICNYVNGKHTNMLLENAKIMAETLEMDFKEFANKII